MSAAYVNAPHVRFRPRITVSVVTDSIGVPGSQGGWEIEIINHCQMLYGTSAPTWLYHSIPAVTIEDATSNGQLAGAIADAPDVILIQLGVNDRFNVSHSHPPPTRPYIAGVAGTMLSTIQAALPNCQIGWLLPLVGGGEQWSPPSDDVNMQGIVLGIQDACATYNVQAIDLHTYWLALEQALNPSQQTGGIITYEGTHPNWRGRPLMARGVIDRILFDDPLYSPNVDVTPSWRPDSDVTPSVWVEADMPAAGPITSVGTGTVFTKFPGYTGGTCVPGAWFNGGPAIRFNGTSDVLTASLSTASGAKTIFLVFNNPTTPATFNTWYSLLSLTNGVVTTEVIPYANSAWGPLAINCDMKASGSDGFFIINTNGITYSGDPGYGYPIRFSAAFAGGSSTNPANYDYRLGGYVIPPSQSAGFNALPLTALCALGARIPDGVTPAMFSSLDLAALLVYPAILTPPQFYRVDQYLRRKWGP